MSAMLKSDVWFVYDGDCPLCTQAATALEIRKSVGPLHIVNAREETAHPLMQEIREKGLDLDRGMVLKYGERCYHGADALNMMALLGSGHGWFNRMNALLFRSKTIARLVYPSMRSGRNILIALRGAGKIRNLENHK
jgi:predicted DCC family thiol-disulfide oxidoreductase YuxK